MMRGFDEREVLTAERVRETELTLSSTTLLAIFFGLVLVCGLCFGLGYAVGRRGSAEPSMAALQPSAGAEVTGSSSKAKPSATPAGAPLTAPAAADGASGSTGTEAGGISAADTDATPPQGTSASGAAPAPGWVVKPALQAANAAQPADGTSLEPAPNAQTLMVQIAAVSHQEDADVLVAALRKHGYAVTVRRDLTDSLLHVEIGPFTNRNDANTMRQKLLNDGYNAMIQP
jgi:cell division septation protein DedD